MLVFWMVPLSLNGISSKCLSMLPYWPEQSVLDLLKEVIRFYFCLKRWLFKFPCTPVDVPVRPVCCVVDELQGVPPHSILSHTCCTFVLLVSEREWVAPFLWTPSPLCSRCALVPWVEHRRSLWEQTRPSPPAPPQRSPARRRMRRNSTPPPGGSPHWVPGVSHDWKRHPHLEPDRWQPAPERQGHLATKKQ